MIPRINSHTIIAKLKHNPAVAIIGPRQVGKTTLAKQISKEFPKASVYLDLERASDLTKLQEPELYFRDNYNKLIIIDEIQRLPSLFKTLRSIIDERREAGEQNAQFLLLGSAALDLIQGVSETLAGRVAYVELGGMNLIEMTDYVSQEQLWVRGGFPSSLLASDDEHSFVWREDFILSYLERDIPALGPRVPAETLRRFWTMVAHGQGQIINQSEIASSLGMSVPTIRRYLDLLVDLMLLRRLQPWAGNIKKRLIKSPKHYVRDSGLLHALLNINGYDSLLSNPMIGKSWEGFVIENLLNMTPKHIVPLFFEAVSNAEIDLLLETRDQELIAIEIKHSLNPKLQSGFYSACQTINPTKKYIVYPGSESFPFDAEIQVVSLIKMMDIVSGL